MTGEDRERRELERRAYGRDATGLTAAETARLAELRGSRRTTVPDRTPVLDRTPVPEPVEGTRPAPLDRVRNAVRAWLATGRWKRPRYLIGTVLALLLIGIVVGVAIPRPPDIGLPLRAGEAERRDKIAELVEFDPGSVQLLARSDTALLWFATMTRGDLLCAVIDMKGSPPEHECGPRAALRSQPIRVQGQGRPGSDGVVAGDQGSLALTGAGSPVGSLEHWTASVNPNPGLGPGESAAWKRVSTENGFQATMIAGHVGGRPIWLGYRDQGGEICLIVEDQGEHKVCGQQDTVLDSGLAETHTPPTLTLDLPATVEHVAYRLEYWTGFSSYLVITANPDPKTVPLFGLTPPS